MHRNGVICMTDEGAINLWGAIWKSAMREEVGACKAFILNELRQHGIKKPHNIIRKFDKKIIEDVSKKIIKEANEYPNGHRGKYNYRKIANEAIEFAMEKCDG